MPASLAFDKGPQTNPNYKNTWTILEHFSIWGLETNRNQQPEIEYKIGPYSSGTAIISLNSVRYAYKLPIYGHFLRTWAILSVDETLLDVVPSFCYMGDMLGAGGACDLAINVICQTALGKFRRLLPLLTSNRGRYCEGTVMHSW